MLNCHKLKDRLTGCNAKLTGRNDPYLISDTSFPEEIHLCTHHRGRRTVYRYHEEARS